jgi:hypothetical protein
MWPAILDENPAATGIIKRYSARVAGIALDAAIIFGYPCRNN